MYADYLTRGAGLRDDREAVSSDDTQGLIEATQNADALFWLTTAIATINRMSYFMPT